MLFVKRKQKNGPDFRPVINKLVEDLILFLVTEFSSYVILDT